MKARTLSIIIFGLIFTLANGCGGSGGSPGRYAIPGDVPTATTTGTGTAIGTTDPDALLASAWQDFQYGAYSSAISKFNQVLTLSNVSASQKADANNGLGWSNTKSTGLESGYNFFSQAASSNDEARIGLASAIIRRGQKSGFTQAVTLLEQVGLVNTSFRFQSTHSIGVSNAEAHALLAFAYFWRGGVGDQDKARSQISTARTEDGSSDSSVAQIYKTLQDMGLTGI
ncbi:MAG: hypothetical protein HQM08_00910 [Candidatus Riflebacteria bacterium]|nr:hypothetical protein [Candidatus Riflebacteria bacterium]